MARESAVNDTDALALTSEVSNQPDQAGQISEGAKAPVALESDPMAPARLRPVARAIEFLVNHAQEQPTLEETAAYCGVSPHHFQKMFKAGAGVSPKRFLQYLSAGRAREALREGQSVLEAAYEAGLSGPSRLHDLVLVADAMTPGAARKKGQGVVIRYARLPGPFGMMLVAATDKGICWLSFDELHATTTQMLCARGLKELEQEWPSARFIEDEAFVAPYCSAASAIFSRQQQGALKDPKNPRNPHSVGLGLHVQGTNFQLKVWEALLRIPHGACVTYGDIAKAIGQPKASRAVGSAVGANPISVLIPCHRVIRASGVIQNYRWGSDRKSALLALEAAAIS